VAATKRLAGCSKISRAVPGCSDHAFVHDHQAVGARLALLRGPNSGPAWSPAYALGMDPAEARALFATAPVARLATLGPSGQPHLVPITFALDGDTLYTAIDHKPKRSTRLRRLENIAANTRVSLLADHYDDDWSRLWWVRADGEARIVAAEEPPHATAVDLLKARYEQYRRRPPTGPAIAIGVRRWSGWRAASAGRD
jgi:PPOX class probable F420-dependent enzyme